MTVFIPDVHRNPDHTIRITLVPVLEWREGESGIYPLTIFPISSFWSDLWCPVAIQFDAGTWCVHDKQGRVLSMREWTGWANHHLSTLEQSTSDVEVNEEREGTDREVPQHHVRGYFSRAPSERGAAEPVAWTIMKGRRVGDTFTRSDAVLLVKEMGGKPGSVNGPLSFMTRCGWLERVGSGKFKVSKAVLTVEESKYPRLRADGVPHRTIPDVKALEGAFRKATKHNMGMARRAVLRYSPSGDIGAVRRDDRLALLDDLHTIR